jgi:hypothetical protein
LEKRVLTAIEFKRRNVMSSTKTAVESRRGFHPFPLEIEFDKTVINKKIGSDKIDQLFRGEVIPNGSKADA